MSWLLKGFLCLSVWLVLFPAGQVAAKSRQSRNEALKVTVLSFDHVNVPEGIQQAAQEQVVRIYRQAGVEITWKDCRTKEELASPSLLCSGLQDENRLYLRIIPRTLNGLRTSTAGLAVRETQVVWIFWDRAQGQSRESATPLPEMLAHLIAHEIGHLLLGPNAHVPYGIMAPYWDARQLMKVAQGGLGFTPSECQRIQDNVAKRHGEIASTLTRGN